jgi:hypothetical protein
MGSRKMEMRLIMERSSVETFIWDVVYVTGKYDTASAHLVLRTC